MSKKRHRPDRAEDEAPKPPEAQQAAGPPPAADDLEAIGAERDDLLARLQRVSADYMNYQKRTQREMAEARDFANAALIKDLLSVLDDMERALDAAAENHSRDDPLLAGMHLVYDKALEVLGRFGLKRIQAEGRPFDPTCHEAIMQETSDQHEAPTVLRELQRGYELKGRVIRPARVIVSAPAEEADAAPADEDNQETTESE